VKKKTNQPHYVKIHNRLNDSLHELPFHHLKTLHMKFGKYLFWVYCVS